MDKTRYNWNAVIQAVSYLTDEPTTKGLEGNGFSVSRADDTTLVVTLVQGEYEVENGSPTSAPAQAAISETPAPTINPPMSEAKTPALSVPATASESTDTQGIVVPPDVVPPAAPNPPQNAITDTGQGSGDTAGVATGQ